MPSFSPDSLIDDYALNECVREFDTASLWTAHHQPTDVNLTALIVSDTHFVNACAFDLEFLEALSGLLNDPNHSHSIVDIIKKSYRGRHTLVFFFNHVDDKKSRKVVEKLGERLEIKAWQDALNRHAANPFKLKGKIERDFFDSLSQAMRAKLVKRTKNIPGAAQLHHIGFDAQERLARLLEVQAKLLGLRASLLTPYRLASWLREVLPQQTEGQPHHPAASQVLPEWISSFEAKRENWLLIAIDIDSWPQPYRAILLELLRGTISAKARFDLFLALFSRERVDALSNVQLFHTDDDDQPPLMLEGKLTQESKSHRKRTVQTSFLPRHTFLNGDSALSRSRVSLWSNVVELPRSLDLSDMAADKLGSYWVEREKSMLWSDLKHAKTVPSFLHALDALEALPLFDFEIAVLREELVEGASRQLKTLGIQLLHEERFYIFMQDLILQGSFKHAQELLTTLVPNSNTSKQSERLAMVRFHDLASRLERYRGEMGKANDSVNAGLKLVSDDEIELKLALLSQKALLAYLRRDLQDCFKTCEQGFALDSPTTEPIVQMHLLAGHVKKSEDNVAAAKEHYQQALTMSERIGYPNGAANALQSLGALKQLKGDLITAQEDYVQAAELYHQENNLRGELNCDFSQVRLCFDIGRMQAALDRLDRIVLVHRRQNNRRDLAQVLAFRGHLLLTLGLRHDGKSILRFALWLAEEEGLVEFVESLNWELALAECLDGNVQDARIHLDLASSQQGSVGKKRYEVLRALLDKDADANIRPVFKSGSLQDSFALIEIALSQGSNHEEEVRSFLNKNRDKRAPKEGLQATRLLVRYQIATDEDAAVIDSYRQQCTQILSELKGDAKDAFASFWIQSPAKKEKLPGQTAVTTPFAQLVQGLDSLRALDSWDKTLKQVCSLLSQHLPVARVAVASGRLQTDRLSQHLPVEEEASSEVPAHMQLVGRKRGREWRNVRQDDRVQSIVARLIDGDEAITDSFTTRDQNEGIVLAQPFHSYGAFAGFVYLECDLDNDVALVQSALNLITTVLGLLNETLEQRRNQRSSTQLQAKDPIELKSTQPRKKKVRYADIVHESEVMRVFLQEVRTLKTSDTTVLIEGESGTGKEMVARAIHGYSKRERKPFLAIDCGSIASNLFDAQFFGYRKGSFTGAHEDRIGFFQAAKGGTLFLDNIAELSPMNQAKLLRVLQEREIRKLGAIDVEKIDVRVIAASNKELHKLVEIGEFRADLFYRLDVVRLYVPTLRSRPEDIPALIRRFVKEMVAEGQTLSFGADVLEIMVRYPWPGNVRELRNEVERAIVGHQGHGVIQREELSAKLLETRHALSPHAAELASVTQKQGLVETLDAIEKSILEHTLSQCEGNISKTAEALNLPRTSVRDRLKKYGLVH